MAPVGWRRRSVLDASLAGAEESCAASFGEEEAGPGGAGGLGGVAVLVGDVPGGLCPVVVGRGQERKWVGGVVGVDDDQGSVEIGDMLGEEVDVGGVVPGSGDQPPMTSARVTGPVATACWSSRRNSSPRASERRRLNRKVYSSR